MLSGIAIIGPSAKPACFENQQTWSAKIGVATSQQNAPPWLGVAPVFMTNLIALPLSRVQIAPKL